MVDLLIHAGANVNASNDLGVAPLWLACVKGNAAIVEKLLRAGANPNAVLPNGETPLMTASRTGNAGAVEALLAHGADIDAKETFRGQTALMWAVAQQHSSVVQALIEHGADINARSHAWPQLINSARDADSTGVYEIAQGGFTPLLFAARHGDLESAKRLLVAGANVNDTAAAGTSALVVSTHSGHGMLAAYLLENGADPNAGDAGYTALHAAVLRGDVELVKALLFYGANPNVPLARGTPARRSNRGIAEDWALHHSLIGATPFWLAARFGEPSIMRVLMASGANPVFVKDGTTPLMAVLQVDNNWGRFWGIRPPDEESRALETIKLLVELGAEINAQNPAGDTALHGAASRGFDTVVAFLAQRGAKLDVKNERGQTPLALAAGHRGASDDSGGHQSTADLLRKLGAKE
jgi:ankyrin repeat protein